MDAGHPSGIDTATCDIGTVAPTPSSPVELSTNPVPSRAESDPFPVTERDGFKLSQLWGSNFQQNVHEILCRSSRDLFDDLQEALSNNSFVPDALILPPPPDELPDDRNGVNDDNGKCVTQAQLLHMIENVEADECAIPADETPKVASPGSPYFPWPTKAVRANITTGISPLTNRAAFPDGNPVQLRTAAILASTEGRDLALG